MSIIHFWDDDGSAMWLRPVLRKPDDESVVRHAWTDVAQHSYPRNEVISHEIVHWKVQHELWPRPDGWSDQKPGVIAVRCVRRSRTAAASAATDSHSQAQLEYDRLTWLLLEVVPTSQDTAEGWKELLLQVCARAERGYGVHDVYIICAIGLKYMLFTWDPKNAGNPAQELRLNIANENMHFPSQLKPVPEASPHVPKLSIAGEPDQYQIDLDKVWSIDPRHIDEQGRATEPFTALETFLARTRTVLLQNPRPALD